MDQQESSDQLDGGEEKKDKQTRIDIEFQYCVFGQRLEALIYETTD